MVKLPNFPMPPSDNDLKKIVQIGSYARMASTQSYRQFRALASTWAVRNSASMTDLCALCERRRAGLALKVDKVYWFHRSRIIMLNNSKTTSSKKGEPKRLDTFNRIKALHDVIAEIIGVDDSWFWEGEIRKCVLEDESKPECVDVFFSLVDMHREYLP